MLIDRLDSLFGAVKTLRRISEHVDTSLIRDEIFAPDGTVKFARPSNEWPHREAYHLFLRSLMRNNFTRNKFSGNITTTVDMDWYKYYPRTKEWMDAFAKERAGRIERVVIAALAPHSQIYRHADRGYYYAPRDRYHLVIQSDGGTMRIAGQEGLLKQGEVWWINNKAGHESFNNSETLRVHLIIDLYPNNVFRRIYNYVFWLYLGLRPKRLTNYYINWPQRFQAAS